MDNIDKREKRAEYRNSRQSAVGKGDDNNRVSNKAFNAGYSGIDWSKKKAAKDICRGCQGVDFKVTVKANHTQHECQKCKRVYCLFGGK